MKKAFTLVELLIVVLVFVTLMGLVFRLSSVGSETEARSRTIMTIQKIENCLSGYYAAFGSYPPVTLHGSRNYNLEVNINGIQTDEEVNSGLDWPRVEAACRSQPVAMNFPFASSGGMQQYIESLSEGLRELHSKDGDEYKDYRDNPALAHGFSADAIGKVGGLKDEKDWNEVQLYRFGLMSYLLPRYLIMMRYRSSSNPYDDVEQWEANNTKPCRFKDGSVYPDWQSLAAEVQSEDKRWQIQLIPNQAVTARWMPNLENLLSCQTAVSCFGIQLKGEGARSPLCLQNPRPPIFSPSKKGGSNQYVLDEITCVDGWGRELYYYSKPPHQSYTLWSAGPNGRTFPPWVPLENLNENDKRIASSWLSDDITQLSN